MRTLAPPPREKCRLGSGERELSPTSLPGLGCGLSGGAGTAGGRRGGGPLIRTTSSLSYLTSGVGPALKVEERQKGPQIEGRKVRASH